jgi:hypothetical protein
MENIDFYTRTEKFFIQLQYGIGYYAEPITEINGKLISHMLEPSVFLDVIRIWEIEYPFLIDVEISKIKNAAANQKISKSDALIVFESLKNQYWFGNPIVFSEEIQKIKDIINKKDASINSCEFISNYIKFLTIKRDDIFEKLLDSVIENNINDRRKNEKAPTNNVRLKALTEFCPELISKLLNCSKDERKDVIHLITGVNREDSYKLLFTEYKRQINEFTIDVDGIDFEKLKNKLKNIYLSK